ncbi:SDR family NAD(P)-dependent oxidoreductase [Enterococcus rivorum]|uniref:SDR family NAD(P)-dependent oxidoreductase n=1 Tax=Enterococcus rivorum TaxID=762845 RepID=UPI003633BDC8
MYSYSLAGKTALVTGASQGIGFEIAKVLSYNGANIIGVANSDLAAVKAVVEKNGKQFSGFVVDLSSESEVIEFVSTVHEKVKTIDILVNNAGVTKVGSTLDMLDSEYDLTFNVNMKAPYILSREIGRQMIQQGGGKIINTASIHGFIGSYEVAAYAATKHAIVGLTKALANEWGQYNINVNAVAPGFTNSQYERLTRK